MKMRKLGAAVALALALLAGGCGGAASKAEFQTDMIAARNRVDDALQQITTATSSEDLLEQMRIAAVEVRRVSTDVAKADAPDGLQNQKRELALTLRAFSEEIASTVDTLAALEGGVPRTRGLDFFGWNETQRRLAALRKGGIQVPDLERH